jgi:hypothetical protein
MRRHRERRRDGLRCMTIELLETEIATLIRKGLLSNDARNDLNSARNAFYSFLDKRAPEGDRDEIQGAHLSTVGGVRS